MIIHVQYHVKINIIIFFFYYILTGTAEYYARKPIGNLKISEFFKPIHVAFEGSYSSLKRYIDGDSILIS